MRNKQKHQLLSLLFICIDKSIQKHTHTHKDSDLSRKESQSSEQRVLSAHTQNGERWRSERKRPEEDRPILHLRRNLDLPELHRHRVQQVHSRQEDVQLAISDLSNHDPHGFLFFHRLLPCPSFPSRGTSFHVKRSLPFIGGTHRSSLFSLSLAF